MEQFKLRLKSRIRLITLFIIALSAFVVIALLALKALGVIPQAVDLLSVDGFGPESDTHVQSFSSGFSQGVFAGLLFGCILYIIYYARALASEDKLRKLHIQESDERNQAIYSKAGLTFCFIAVSLAASGAVIANFINPYVAVTLIAVTISLSILEMILLLYFLRKL